MKSSGKQLKQIDWDKTYTDYYSRVRSVIGKIVGFDHNFLDDMISETFERGIKYQKKFNSEKATFSTWICTIGKNVALQDFRRKDYLPITIDVEEEIEEDLSDENKILYDKVMRIIESFDDIKGKRIFFDILNGMTYDQIAQREGLKNVSIRGIIKRFLDKLRNEMLLHPEFGKYKKSGKFISILNKKNKEFCKCETIEKGIYKKENRYVVYSTINKKWSWIGNYKTLEEAKKAKKEKEK